MRITITSASWTNHAGRVFFLKNILLFIILYDQSNIQKNYSQHANNGKVKSGGLPQSFFFVTYILVVSTVLG